MNDIDRNARTLIICFVVAVFSLTVLRFVELGQNMTTISQVQVLGETIQKDDQVVLPNAQVEVLRARYIGGEK